MPQMIIIKILWKRIYRILIIQILWKRIYQVLIIEKMLSDGVLSWDPFAKKLANIFIS